MRRRASLCCASSPASRRRQEAGGVGRLEKGEVDCGATLRLLLLCCFLCCSTIAKGRRHMQGLLSVCTRAGTGRHSTWPGCGGIGRSLLEAVRGASLQSCRQAAAVSPARHVAQRRSVHVPLATLGAAFLHSVNDPAVRVSLRRRMALVGDPRCIHGPVAPVSRPHEKMPTATTKSRPATSFSAPLAMPWTDPTTIPGPGRRTLERLTSKHRSPAKQPSLPHASATPV